MKCETERGERVCWLCGRNGARDPLDEHHIFGGARRGLSEQYGLTVRLCHSRCHLFGPKAAHNCRETADALHEWGQRKAMTENDWTCDEFRMLFGKNYVDDVRTDAFRCVSAVRENSASTSPFFLSRPQAGPAAGGFGGAAGFAVTDLEMPF